MALDLVEDTNNEEKTQFQLDLFSLVDQSAPSPSHPASRVVESYSNTIGAIELIPRFVRGRGNIVPFEDLAQKKHSKDIINEYYSRGKLLTCTIKPCVVSRKDGDKINRYLAYSGEREELTEKALIRLAVTNGLECFALPSGLKRYGLSFTLYSLRQELIKIGKTRSFDVVRESLEIIRDSKVLITDKEAGVAMTINTFADVIMDVSGKGRGRERCRVIFSDYLIEQILNLQYRQYPFINVNSHDIALTRFMHSYMLHNWTNATPEVEKTFYLNVIFEAFGKKDLDPEVKRRDFKKTLQNLYDAGLIDHIPHTVSVQYQGAQDKTYTFKPTANLVEQIKRAHQKHKGIRTLLEEAEKKAIYKLPRPTTEWVTH